MRRRAEETLATGQVKPKGAASRADAESRKELSRLRRVDLLELLLDEIRENERNSTALAEATEMVDRLKAKLDAKDAQIEHLISRLDMKDERIKMLVGDADPFWALEGASYGRIRGEGRASTSNAQASHGHTAVALEGALDIDELMAVQRRAVEEYLASLGLSGQAPVAYGSVSLAESGEANDRAAMARARKNLEETVAEIEIKTDSDADAEDEAEIAETEADGENEAPKDSPHAAHVAPTSKVSRPSEQKMGLTSSFRNKFKRSK